MLPLWTLDLLMEYPQDHFIFDALYGKRGGEEDEVVDGDIYYCDVLFLSWVSKHEGEDLQAALGSFLFIEVYQTIMEVPFMDPYIFLLPTYGESFVFAIQNLHARTIPWQCIAPQVSKLLIFLHNQCWAKLYDGGSHLLCGLGKVCFTCMYDQPLYLIIHSSSTIMVTYITIHISKSNFPYNY